MLGELIYSYFAPCHAYAGADTELPLGLRSHVDHDFCHGFEKERYKSRSGEGTKAQHISRLLSRGTRGGAVKAPKHSTSLGFSREAHDKDDEER